MTITFLTIMHRQTKMNKARPASRGQCLTQSFLRKKRLNLPLFYSKN